MVPVSYLLTLVEMVRPQWSWVWLRIGDESFGCEAGTPVQLRGDEGLDYRVMEVMAALRESE